MSNRPKTVVIGYGMAGRLFHTYLVGLTSDLELHGVCSRNPETRAQVTDELGCATYESLEQVLGDDAVDLVVLASPSHVHTEQAVQALNAGKHVVTDKPMCRNMAEYDQIVEAADRAGKVLSVFHNRRWDGDYLTVRKLIDEGTLTQVRRIEVAWSMTGMPRGWRASKEAAGGRVYDLASHMIDQLCQLVPQRVTSVYAKLQHDSQEFDVESDAVIVIGFEDGATGVVTTGANTFIPKPRFYLTGMGGTFVKYGLDPQEACMKAGDIDAAVEDPELYGTLNTTGDRADDQRIPTLPGRWRSYYEGVAACLLGTGPNPVPPETVRPCVAIIDAVFESARTGETIQTDIAAAPVEEE